MAGSKESGAGGGYVDGRRAAVGWRRRLGCWGSLEPLAAPELPPEQEDLLADVRNSRRYRFFRRFATGSGGRPWKLAAVLTAVFFVLWGWGQFFAPDFRLGGGGPSGSEFKAGAAGSAADAGGDSGGFGRPGDVARASRYGRVTAPAGPGGLPVIEHSGTGEVREVTAIELEFPANRPYLSAGPEGVVWNPGPRGLGLWWRRDLLAELRLNRLMLDRFAWRERQYAELEYALGELSYALGQFDLIDLVAWEYGPPARIHESMTRLQARYPAARTVGAWSAVPGQWVCDPNLERDLEGERGPGCPSAELNGQLTRTWHQVGLVAERLRELGRRGQQLSRMRPDTVVDLQLGLRFGYSAVEGRHDLRQLRQALEELSEMSRREELPINLRLGG